MKALPPAPKPNPDRYHVSVDRGLGRDVTVIEKWWDDGRHEVWIGGKLIQADHFWNRKPFVKMDPRWSMYGKGFAKELADYQQQAINGVHDDRLEASALGMMAFESRLPWYRKLCLRVKRAWKRFWL